MEKGEISLMLFYVGTYTRLGGPGLAVCSLTDSQIDVHNTYYLPNPTYAIMSARQDRLYAISGDTQKEPQSGSYAAFEINGDQLSLLHQYSTDAVGPCHLCLSPDERFLYTANYMSGTLTVFPLDPPGEHIQLLRHSGKSVHPTRQEAPHVHHVSFIPGTQVLAAIDLGIDAIVLYRQDPASGRLTEQNRLICPPGMGPRHLIYKNHQTAYLVHELGSAVSVLNYDGRNFSISQTQTTLPENWKGSNTCAAVRIKDDYVFASNRGHDSIAVFRTGENGFLERVGIFPTGGETPRDFVVLSNDQILVGHQGGTLSLLYWDRQEETIHSTGSSISMPGAVCICPKEPLANT